MGTETDGFVPIRRALLAVSDKSGLVDFARRLTALHIDLVATDGTRARLQEAGIAARSVEEVGGPAAAFGGRIKTLHPSLLGPILAPRTASGRAELAAQRLEPIDLVVVNFYPFAEQARAGGDADALAEAIDIGGVTLARAAAKNSESVAVVTDPGEYPHVAEELERNAGSLSATTRQRLARAAFRRTAAYDVEIANGIAPPRGTKGDPFPDLLLLDRSEVALRYGENPHQAGAVFRRAAPSSAPIPPTTLISEKGPPLSYTNLLDLDTALGVVAEFDRPAAAIVKHATVCGAATTETVGEALAAALATDPVARYGCTIAVNRPFPADATASLKGVFVDVLAAPDYAVEARRALDRRPKLKTVRVEPPPPDGARWELRSAAGHVLVQEIDRRPLVPADFKQVSQRSASDADRASLEFAWRVARHARSNSIVLAQGTQTVGIGSGQPTRVTAVELAVRVAGDRAQGSALASDAFFPFADGIDVAGKAGIGAILQPGGSVRDAEVIAAADRWKMAMYFTGWRIFRH
ncbi:MAG TPA: bifunctional phosphoribosylaminoimidazolecarboxamide formyltransferase/IMP cyclohydrolase [Thermoplasmata archaeon]|nr:bifunctional phosphoribosylaminoimidazolecarboxamide formyltransferase/IMP cyclohydrolase [Thermoplasmata archaeon]